MCVYAGVQVCCAGVCVVAGVQKQVQVYVCAHMCACMCTCHKCSGILAEDTELSCSIPLLYSPETGPRVVADKPQRSSCFCLYPHSAGVRSMRVTTLGSCFTWVLVLVQQALSLPSPLPSSISNVYKIEVY